MAKVIGKEYLETQFKNYDAEKVVKRLFNDVVIPEHYKLADVQDGSVGLIIVADGTLTNADTEVEEATVLAKLNGADPVDFVVGAYVELVPEETVQESVYLPRTEIPEMDFETEDIDFENL